MAINLEKIGRTVEQYMIDQVTIERVTGTTYNSTTMEVGYLYDTIYSGKAFVVPMGDPAGTRLGGEDVQRIQYEIAIPRGSPQILPNDVITVTASDDGSLVDSGDKMFVHDEIPTTFYTHRRIKAFKDTSAV